MFLPLECKKYVFASECWRRRRLQKHAFCTPFGDAVACKNTLFALLKTLRSLYYYTDVVSTSLYTCNVFLAVSSHENNFACAMPLCDIS